LADPEVVCLTVGFLVKKHIFVVAQPEPESAMVPKPLVILLSFLRVVVKGTFFGPREQEPPEAMLTELK
jgi:hypothetical protein